MIVEMHCHTAEYSACSHVSAAELVKKALQVGIQVVVLTDHHHLWSDAALDDLRKKSGLPETLRVFSGQEVTTCDYGDILLYGAEETVHSEGLALADLRAQYPDAAIVWAHPYRDKAIPTPDQLLSPLFDAVEVFSSNHSIVESSRALRDWHKHRFTAIGGTDTHAYSYTGSYPTIFDHPIQSMKDLANELRAGRCRPFFKEIPRTGTTNTMVTEVTIGPKSAEKRKKIIVKTFDGVDAWKSGKRSFRIAKELLRHGFDHGKYRIPKPLGKDARSLAVIEERTGGENLYETLIRAKPEDAREYLRMAARWLCKLHNLNLSITPEDEYLRIEPDRADYYLKSLVETGNQHAQRVREIKDVVIAKEIELIENRPAILVQGHGDYHLKNIFINKDDGDLSVAVIDFDSSYQLPRAFDVGTFLAQYINMLIDHSRVQRNAPSGIFLQTYLATAEHLEDDFLSQVCLYKARTCLSILYYLAKVGMGDAEVFWRIVVEAEKNLASIL